MTNAVITGWGKCTPPSVLTNHDLATFLDTSDEWIQARTGIQERRISNVAVSDMAEVAARHALACAGVDAADVDLVILATACPDTMVPSAAARLQKLLGAHQAAVLDMNAACTGFVYGLSAARSAVVAGDHQTVLLVGAEKMTWYLDWTHRDTAVLFGDGAGAVVIQPGEDAEAGIFSGALGCDYEGQDALKIPDYGTSDDRYSGPKGKFTFQFDGREIFKRAVVGMGNAAVRALEKAGIAADEIDLVVPHQANIRIIEALVNRLKLPMSKVMINIQKYGNTSAATIPIALCEAVEEGRVRPGSNILTAAFGAGLTWGSMVLRWTRRVRPVATSQAALPPCDRSGLELLSEAIGHSRRLATPG
ncbi:MAG: ketoacyl-ACP synthase III [Xanthomonadales bacterium]|nr:ketoacyl-ACP synthase III [Xanthomonadales bacterium]